MSHHSYHPTVTPPTEWAPLELDPETGPAVTGQLRPEHAPSIRPRGLPLTETMPFTTPDGVRWVAYIEGFPRESRPFRNRTLLPGRRLRFDSDCGSWVSSEVPAGAPFLPEARLTELLRRAQPYPPPCVPAQASMRIGVWRWMMESATRSVRWGGKAAAELHRRWRQNRHRASARLHLAMASIRRRG